MESKQTSANQPKGYQRTSPRLLLELEIQAKVLRSDVDSHSSNPLTTSALLTELSVNGALIAVQSAVGKVGDMLELLIPNMQPEGLALQAEIIRLSPGEKDTLVTVKFSLTDAGQHEALAQACVALLEKGDGGRRAHARVAHHMEVWYGDQSELRAILQNVSQGGMLMVTVEDPPKLHQSVQVVIPTPPADELKLMARVVHEETHSDQTWVGLQFEELGTEARDRITTLLYLLIDSTHVH
ncbi:MAG: PilZ domain-containing protein [Gammaproteobacteria bacterium]|nr:PilZ domain-containing protein [Gammaproteobacteria bacterium]